MTINLTFNCIIEINPSSSLCGRFHVLVIKDRLKELLNQNQIKDLFPSIENTNCR